MRAMILIGLLASGCLEPPADCPPPRLDPALVAAALNSDLDGDGRTAGQEFAAGTNPDRADPSPDAAPAEPAAAAAPPASTRAAPDDAHPSGCDGDLPEIGLCRARWSLEHASVGAALEECGRLTGDPKQYCYGLVKREAKWCTAIVDPIMRADCNTAAGEPEPSAAHTAAAAWRAEDCERLPPGDEQWVCRARTATSTVDAVHACSEVGFHDQKLYCMGLVRSSPGSCLQVMDKALEARCLEEIGCPGYPDKSCPR